MSNAAPIDRTIPIAPISEIKSFGQTVCGAATLDKLKVDESFVVDDKVSYHRVYSAARHRGMKLRTKKEGERYRIWRTE